MGYTDDSNVELANAIHILDVGRLHEGVDARKVGQLTSGKGRDVAVDDTLSGL